MPGQDSIEFSYAELKKAIQLKGFEFVVRQWSLQSLFLWPALAFDCTSFFLQKEEHSIPSTFTQDPNSMLQYHYKCVLTVLRKPAAESQA